MSVKPLLLSLILVASAPVDDLPRSSLQPRDLGKLTKGIQGAFDALLVDDITAEQDALDTIAKELAKLAKKAKLDAPLQYVGDWDLAFELAKPADRDIKSKVGKGFFRYTFHDEGNPKDEEDDLRAGCLISIPSAYTKSEELLPVVVALKPTLGVSGSDLEEKVLEMAEAMYADLVDSHIVLVPLGPEVESGRSFEAQEVEGSWLVDGLVPFFTTFRVLLERVRFDRARVVLDGWGDAGLDAMLLSTSFPSWFAGVINRSGEPGDDLVIYGNLGDAAVLYVHGAGDAREVDLEALRGRQDAAAGITVIEEEGSALAPGEETRQAITEWLGERKRDLAPTAIDYKLGDIRFQSIAWLKATDPRVRASARPGDRDFPHLKAQVDRSTNTIDIEAVNVLEVSIFLSDALVDMGKPVRIVVNGEERENRLFPRDLRTMVQNRFFNDDGSYGIYTAKTTIGEIPPNIPEAP
ncbi:MAG: hypothetical protein ACYTG2_04845 [Planctomycetota bacterium]|jgi:hypothetical protein